MSVTQHATMPVLSDRAPSVGAPRAAVLVVVSVVAVITTGGTVLGLHTGGMR